MSDIELKEIKSGYNLGKINDNFEKLEAVINSEVMHLEGDNNVMKQNLDMNNHKILNLPTPVNPTDVVRVKDVGELVFQTQVSYVQETAPIDVSFDGSRWYKPSEATTYIYYTDESGDRYWVEEPVAVCDPLFEQEAIFTTLSLLTNTEDYDVGTSITTTGFNSSGDGGGAQWVATATTGLSPSQTPTDRGAAELVDATGRLWEYTPSNGIYYGSALGIESGNVTSVLQDLMSSGGRVVDLSGLSLSVQSSGSQINSRNYAITIPSNTTLLVDKTTITFLNDGNVYDGITNDRNGGNENITIKGSLTIVGNNATRTQGGNAVWFERVSGLNVDGLTVNESTGFGFRLNRVSDFVIRNYRCTTTLDQPGDDGIHLYDCNTGLIDGAIINTAGDDCFVISAEQVGSHDIVAKNLVLSSPTGNRGVLLNLADLADNMYTIKNISVQAVCNDCADGPAALLSQATFENINLDIQSIGCKNGLAIDLPSIGFGAGLVRNSTFNIQSNGDLENGIVINDTGTVEGNTLNASVYNNGDGFDSVILRGTGWSGSISVDNDPDAAKATPLNCIDMFADNSNMALIVKNADEGVNLRSSAIDNNFSIVESNCTNYSIDNASNSAVCTFTGGKIESPVRLVNENSFSNVRGATLDGVVTDTTDGSGLIDLTHGLVAQPRIAIASYVGTDTYTVRISNITSSIVRFGVYDETGAPVASASVTISYSIKL
jgi:hypothetical protein